MKKRIGILGLLLVMAAIAAAQSRSVDRERRSAVVLAACLSGQGLHIYQYGAFPPSAQAVAHPSFYFPAQTGRRSSTPIDLPNFAARPVACHPGQTQAKCSHERFTMPAMRAESGWTWIAIEGQVIHFVDIDGDAQPEIVGSFDGYGIYYCDLATKLWTYIYNLPIVAISRVDFDGDGKDEWAGRWAGYGLYYRTSDGQYPFIHAEPIGAFTWTDLDGDGREEVAFAVTSGAEQGTYLYQITANGPKLTQIHSLAATMVYPYTANGKTYLVAGFEGFGLWCYHDSTWENYHACLPLTMCQVYLDNRFQLAACFNTVNETGVYVRAEDGTWSRITDKIATAMTSADTDQDDKQELILAIPDMGIYQYSSSQGWKQLHVSSVTTPLVFHGWSRK